MLIEFVVLDKFILHVFSHLAHSQFSKKIDSTTCVTMKVEYVLKLRHHSKFNNEQTWEDLCDHLKALFLN